MGNTAICMLLMIVDLSRIEIAMNESPASTAAYCGKTVSGKFVNTVAKIYSVSVLTATALDRRRDVFAVHEPTLIVTCTTLVNGKTDRTADLPHIDRRAEQEMKKFHTESALRKMAVCSEGHGHPRE